MTRGRITRSRDGFSYEESETLGYLVYSSEPPHEHLGSVQHIAPGAPHYADRAGWRARRHDLSELPDLFATRYGAAIALRSEPPTLL